MVASLTARTGSEGEGGISHKGECTCLAVGHALHLGLRAAQDVRDEPQAAKQPGGKQ